MIASLHPIDEIHAMHFVAKSKLPRLARGYYQGCAAVFWTHTFEHRATGWLTEAFHQQFCTVLLHACARYQLACPMYVLMPDHWHLVWLGISDESDQLAATTFLRRHARESLPSNARLQDRAHDHVLRNEERKQSSFADTCTYVRENPVRAGLVTNSADWPYLGAMISGYPDIHPTNANFWEKFWKIYQRRADAARA